MFIQIKLAIWYVKVYLCPLLLGDNEDMKMEKKAYLQV